MDLAASAGLILDDWQADVLDGALGERPDGKWAASQVGVVVPRQNGKGSILEARALAGLFLFREPLILWTAHEFKTAKEGFLRFRALIDNYDHLRKRVKIIRTGAGDEGIELLNSGPRLRFLARSGGSGRGFSAPCLFLDEAYALTEDQVAAIMPTMSAQPNSQAWFMSSAPLVHSVVLRRLCKSGRSGEAARLAYSEWRAARDAETMDRSAWAAANPTYGRRITDESLQSLYDVMGDDEFRREMLGIWFEEDEDQVIDPRVWQARIDTASRITGPRAFAVDIRPDRKATAISVAGRREDGIGHVEVVEHRSGTGWVVERLVELAAKWEPCAVTLDPAGQAGSLIKALNEAGFVTEPKPGQWQLQVVGAREAAQGHGMFVDDVVNDRLRHIDQTPLNAALTGAKTRPLADAAAWSRKDSSVDITPLVTATLALYGFATYGVEEPPEEAVPMVVWR